MTTPNLEQIDQFAEIAWRKACDRARAAEGNSPTTAKWEVAHAHHPGPGRR